jgi:CubicO group peptidase (beta-lactamase class C family)
MKLKKIFFIVISIVLFAAAFFLWRLAPIANGYTAKYLCSLTFTSGLDPEKGFELYVKPMHFLFGFVRPEVDTTRKEVTSAFFGFFRPRTALWREGCGCTLLVEDTVEELHQRHHVPERLMAGDTSIHSNALWPEGNNVSRDSLSQSVNWTAIDNILDEAMRETTDDPLKRNNTMALVIAWKGRIIGERYAEGVDESTSLLGWSAAKSITAALTGVMVQYHNLDIHAPIGLPEWANDERRDITIDHLLRMESGLDFEENYAPLADATEMLYGSADMGTFALKHPPAAAPGKRWSYSSGTTNLLADILYKEIGGTPKALHHLAYDEFFNRLGITTAVFEHDESDAFVGSSYLYMSARDWLRVCKLHMDNGAWNGERILPIGWVKYALTPTPNATDACFGAHVWLNAAPDPADRRLPGLPADAFIFRGFQGQWIVGIPSLDLMVARLGVTHDDDAWSPEGVVLEVMKEINKR